MSLRPTHVTVLPWVPGSLAFAYLFVTYSQAASTATADGRWTARLGPLSILTTGRVEGAVSCTLHAGSMALLLLVPLLTYLVVAFHLWVRGGDQPPAVEKPGTPASAVGAG